MVMLAKYPIKNVASGSTIKFLYEMPDLNILKGDIGTVSRRKLPRGRGQVIEVKFDDGSSADIPGNTIVLVTKESPQEVAARGRIYGGVGRLAGKGLELVYGKPKKSRPRRKKKVGWRDLLLP